MPKKEVLSTPNVTPGQGPMSQATRFGNMVYIQGFTGRHPTTEELGKGIKEQTAFALDRIKALLETAGTSLDNVLTNTCYVTSREDLAGFNETYAEYFKIGPTVAYHYIGQLSQHRNIWWKSHPLRCVSPTRADCGADEIIYLN